MCGCKERKRKRVAMLEERGHMRTARALQAIPTPEDVAEMARKVKRTVLRARPPEQEEG
jgi:hypothetical protein